MPYLKHKSGSQPKKRGAKSKTAAKPEAQHPSGITYMDVNGLRDIAASMDAIENAVIRHVDNAYSGQNKLAVFTGPSGSGFHPVLIALEPSDTMDQIIEVSERIATAFERIADAMTAKTGGVV
jgi:hypothetical protein